MTLATATAPHATQRALALLGVSLGATYWLKSSLFLTATLLLFFIARVSLRNGSGLRRYAHLPTLALGFALPVLALIGLNLYQSHGLQAAVSTSPFDWVPDDRLSMQPANVLASAIAAPGLGLFQSDLWLTHVTSFSDAHLPLLRGLSRADRILLKSALAIPLTLLLCWGLWQARTRVPAISLAMTLVIGYVLEFALLSVVLDYNFLGNEPRLETSFMPMVQGLLLAGTLSSPRRSSIWKPVAVSATVFVCLASSGFACMSFLKRDIRDRYVLGYRTSPNGLLMPQLSNRDVADVQAALRAAQLADRDVIALVGTPGWGSAFVPWLELSQRSIPIGSFCAPLGRRYRDAAYLTADSELTTSRNLQLLLVVARSLVADGSLERMKARFPQATHWSTLPMPVTSAVAAFKTRLVAARPVHQQTGSSGLPISSAVAPPGP